MGLGIVRTLYGTSAVLGWRPEGAGIEHGDKIALGDPLLDFLFRFAIGLDIHLFTPLVRCANSCLGTLGNMAWDQTRSHLALDLKPCHKGEWDRTHPG